MIALKAANTGTISTTPQTVTLPATTALNDCIVVIICIQGTAAVTVSGAGATWVEAVNDTLGAPELVIWVGYGAAASNTTISVTNAGGISGSWVLGMFTGCAFASSPVVPGTGQGNNTAVGNSLTSVSVSSTAVGQAFISAAGNFGSTAWAGTTWASGTATNSIGTTVGAAARTIAADFVLAGPTRADAATFGWTGGAGALAGIVVLAPPAPNSGMLAVMGP